MSTHISNSDTGHSTARGSKRRIRSELRALRDEVVGIYERGRRENGTTALQTLNDAEAVLARARRADDPFGIGYCSVGIAYCLIRLQRFDEASRFLETAQGCFESIGDRKGPLETSLLRGNILNLQYGRYDEALEIHIAVARHATEFDDVVLNSRVQLGIGWCYLMLGDSAAALASFLESALILERKEEFEQLLQTRMFIAMLYMHIRDNERTITEYQRALELARRLGDRRNEATALGEIGLVYKRLGQPDRALEKFEESRAILERIDDTSYLPELLSYFAMIYDNRGDHRKALEYVTTALAEITPSHRPRLYVTCMIILGNIHARQNAPREAIRYYEQARADVGDNAYPWDLRFISLNLAECYECIGDAEHALKEYRKYLAIMDELMGGDQNMKIRRLQRKFQEERTQRELQHQQEHAARLRDEASARARDLTAMTLQLVRKHEFLGQIRTRLQNAASIAEPQTRERLQGIAEMVRRHTTGSDEWSLFEEYFHNVHPDFRAELRKRSVRLTDKEMKVCMLLKIGLSSKEIANVLCASLRSVETYRFRIRKKLNLGEEDNLTTTIVSL